MKKVKTNDVAPGIRQPLGAVSVAHIQQGFTEALEALVRGVIQDYQGVVLLHGAVVSKAGQNFSCTAGAAYHAGEVFPVLAGSFIAPSGQIGVWKVQETFLASDPVTFTDLVPRNVHAIRTLVLEPGVAGSGLANWDGTQTYTALLGLESFALKFQEEAVELDLGQGFQVAPYPSAKFHKNTVGLVSLSGVRGNSSGNLYSSQPFIIGTLPPEYSPFEDMVFPTTSLDGLIFVLVHVKANGQVLFDTSKSTGSHSQDLVVSLSGISFVAAQV